MTEPFTGVELAEMRSMVGDAEPVAMRNVDVLRLIAMAERLLRVEPVAEAAATFIANNRKNTVPFAFRCELEALINALVDSGLITKEGDRR